MLDESTWMLKIYITQAIKKTIKCSKFALLELRR